MSDRRPTSNRSAVMNKVLVIALVIVTVLPILIFATDFSNSNALRSARQTALKRSVDRGERRDLDPEARRVRVRELRAKIHPTVGTIAAAMTLQLVLLTSMAVVGRRLFALRL